jgi:hypothetical protein
LGSSWTGSAFIGSMKEGAFWQFAFMIGHYPSDKRVEQSHARRFRFEIPPSRIARRKTVFKQMNPWYSGNP